jgi:60 kDa SS-A/Ro ribonucleoprotein
MGIDSRTRYALIGPKGKNMSNAIKNLVASDKKAKVSTPQTKRAPGRTDQVKNNAGGFVFSVDDRSRLERFLILGTDGGTYYVGERKLTNQNVDFVTGLIAKNEYLVVNTLAEVADANRAAKNSPSLYVLALVLAKGTDKAYVRESGVFDKVVRTSTHLFEFANYVDALGGWGRSKRDLIASWYTGKEAGQLAYQAVKYRSREGWTHRDLFRKVHPVGINKHVGDFILDKPAATANLAEFHELEYPDVLDGFKRMQKATSAKEVISVLNEYKGLPWETIPTEFLKDSDVWKTLFYNGAVGQTALLRNVTRFAKIGAFDDLKFAGDVAQALSDADRIVKGRVHPVAYANALGIYSKGKITSNGYYGYGDRTKDWDTNAKVLGGIEAGFYESFATVTPAGKRTLLATDVSGSMTWGAPAGLVGMNYLEAAAVMAMVTLRTEPYAVLTAFATQFQEVNVSDTDSFETVLNKYSRLHMGGTDVSAPMRYAKDKGLEIDTFVVYSDMETWAGNTHVFQSLNAYRKSSGINAKLAAVGLASTSSTVADPKDKDSMNFVGFDSTAPSVLADFSAGRL